MKTLKAILTVLVLALTLSITANAGEIHTPGLTVPGTPGVTQPARFPGDIGLPGEESPAPEEVYTPGLTAILLTLAALF